VLIDHFAKLNRRTRNAISAVLVVITTLLLYDSLVAPHVVYLSTATKHGIVLTEMLKTSKIVKSAIVVKGKKLKTLSGQFTNLQDALFTVKDAKEFFSDLQAISEQAGCAVYSLNFVTDDGRSETGQSEDSSGIIANSAMLSVIGEYGEIVELVKRLKTRPQKVWIDSLRMMTHSDGSGRLKCDITVKIYTIPDKENFSL
jgi:hypothetical protein